MATSIGKRVENADKQFSNGDIESALHDICSAVEATAKREAGKGGRNTYKDFIHNNLGLITKAGVGVQVLNINLAFDHPKVKRNQNGTIPIEEIFYHVVRCGLYHGEYLPSNLTFSSENVIKCDDGKSLIVPQSLVLGLIIAVVVSPANSKEFTSESTESTGIRVNNLHIPYNWLWGKKSELLALFDALDQTHKALRAIDPRLTSDHS